ncbi:formylglycine-generating enzyme family protein [Rhodohalobacter sp. SW132]|uniref:formylglycine-generating enzyme family protein n=1 Tax=Rhodohalobacter sp. SW132 TaxID=2293433 RepID=UPI000E243A39|nr:SUMF1/EgtB/PvdO family nonheme iron enzyme [Rhodohalobacter sp. SW132]REL33053.1 formylglycine-generating enzyme family protein [Rhodohalobacter sp. SW132]
MEYPVIKKIYVPVSSVIVVFTLFIVGFYPFQTDDLNSFTDYTIEIPGSEVELNMVAVPGGTFSMGSPQDEPGRSENEGPRREITVDSFWMGKHEISWSQYDLFANEVISRLEEELADGSGRGIEIEADAISTPTPPYVDMTFGMGRDGYPAISMTHYAAIMYAKWLTAKTGDFYRLPTEAEWEYACRAGTETAYHFGNSTDEIDRYVWHSGNSDRSYNRVATKESNAFGLYDMSGNLAEWTMDQYYEDYFERLEEDPADNPWFRPTELYPRSVRGGSWQDDVEDQRCAKRRGSQERWKMLDPQMPKSLWWHTSAQFVGFRLVRPVETPPAEVIEQYWIEEMQDF